MVFNPNTFADKMAKHWIAPPLSNVASEQLKIAWADMADTFNRHIQGKIKGKWSILQLPTGAGKTQGLSLYCSLLPKADHPGVLIVTNLIKEAEIIEKEINRLSKQPGTALLCHAENKKEVMASIPSTPVLIVTHNAYKKTWENGESEDLYSKWNGGKRKLTVIDEALDIVESYKVTIDELRFLRGVIPQHLASTFPKEIAVIDEAIEKILSALSNQDKDNVIRFGQTVSSFAGLAAKIKKLPLSSYPDGTAKKCKKILKNLRAVSSDWSIYSSSGQHYFLGTARFLLPKIIKDAVVLDATVSENPISKMLGEKFQIHSLPERIKSYSNVKLHVSYGHNVGKTHLEQQSEGHFQELLNSLSSKIPNNSKTFLCVHKNIEKYFEHLDDTKFSLAHWYAINGSNAYKDCQTAIIYGLPYLALDVATSVLLAFLFWKHDIEKTTYKEKNLLEVAKKHADDYILRHIIVSIVQAINRIHCRKIIDQEGNCPISDVFLYLNKKETQSGDPSSGKKIIKAIKRLMPDVDIKEWDAPKLDSKKSDDTFTRNEKKIIEFFEVREPGKYGYAQVEKETGLSDREMQRHSPQLSEKNKGQSILSLRLPGVTYFSRKGPGAEKYFIKIAE